MSHSVSRTHPDELPDSVFADEPVTRYQIFLKNDDGIIKAGDPYEFLSMAEAHAESLRDALALVPGAEKTVVVVEPVAEGA